MTDRIVKIGFILTPLFWFFVSIHSLNGGFLLPRQGQFVAMMCVAIAALSWISSNKWIRAFGLYAVAWIVFANVYALCVPDTRFVIGAVDSRDFARHFMVALAIYIAVTRADVETETWFNVICLGAIVQSAIAIPQYFGYYPDNILIGWTGIKTDNSTRLIVGTMENSNFFSAYLAISLPFFLRRNWFYFLPVLIVHLILARTTTAWAAAAVGVCVFVDRRWMWTVGAALVALYVFLKSAWILDNDRFQLWAQALRNYNWNWFGIPFGQGPYAFWGQQFPLHNDWLQHFYQFGAVGMGIVAGYVVTIYRGNRILFAAFVAVCVNMIGNFPTQIPPTAFLIILILALIEKERRENDRIQHDTTGRVRL